MSSPACDLVPPPRGSPNTPVIVPPPSMGLRRLPPQLELFESPRSDVLSRLGLGVLDGVSRLALVLVGFGPLSTSRREGLDFFVFLGAGRSVDAVNTAGTSASVAVSWPLSSGVVDTGAVGTGSSGVSPAAAWT